MPNQRIQKALSNLNAYIDDDRQRLCDRVKCLEFWHKRLTKDLKHVLELFEEAMADNCEIRRKYAQEVVNTWNRDIVPTCMKRS